MTGDTSAGFVVHAETGYSPPSAKAVRRSWLRAAVEMVNAATGSTPSMPDPARGEPRWRAVLLDGGTLIAQSRWSTDWPHVEGLVQDWRRRVAAMAPGEVRSQAHRWNSE